jgi:carbamoyl-phosphate synthase small subunit
MPGAFGTADEVQLKAAAAAEPGTDSIDLAATVTCDQPYEVAAAPDAPSRRIVALDFGIKTTILRHLAHLGSVRVVPAGAGVDQILAADPDGVFLSNGPGDPSAVADAAETISGLLGRVPVFGICLGHQLLSTALGAATYKLPFGHHGGNHPVRDLPTGRIDITSQNHNYCVADEPIGGATITHRNLNDGTIEGLACPDLRAFSVQYHPEAGPGPHDAAHLFDRFAELMGATR